MERDKQKIKYTILESRARFGSQIDDIYIYGDEKGHLESVWIFKRPATSVQSHGECQH